jgi:hypothetical protein
MKMPNKQTLTSFSPKGTARWPKLREPDRKFNKDGEYSTQLILEQGAETDAYIAALDETHALAVAAVKTANGKPDAAEYTKPWHKELGDDGMATGGWIVKYKLKALIRPKNGNAPFSKSVAVVDAKGKAFTNADVGAGSTIRCKSEMFPWFTATMGAGVTMQLVAVQVIDLVTNDVASGFDIEDGFEAIDSGLGSVDLSGNIAAEADGGDF